MIMHIAMPLGNGNTLMGTDAIEEMGQKLIQGNNFHISISPDSEAWQSIAFKFSSPIGEAFLFVT